ncbi:MAG TPA: hypothetical protein VL284_10015, partial [Thermoanaerobaculia bacterium]|nr:hypothetical protein [Thermoanaerobaculia bacterium]
AGMTVDAGQLTYLTAFAPDATSYQWYRGTAPDTTNPLMGVGSTAEGFVQKLYIDVLHRNATPAEISTLASAIGGGTSHADAALQLLSSDEYRTLLITSDYSAYLHRAAAPSEIAFWLPGLAAGLTDEPLAAAILSSPEYFALSGGTNTLWLNRVFNDLLGRTPNAAETASDLAALATNARAAVARDVLTSAEARTRLVQGWFHAFLRHDADSTSLSFYLGMLATLHDEQVMSAILGSDEYMNFGSMLPVGPLSETTSFWVSASNNGCAGNSLTAIVTVRECAAPSISTQPQNATVTVGNSATFSVDADGATSYQWYRGNAGDTSSPVTGATNAVFVTASLTSVGTTHFWVRASNGCGSSDSSTVTATVTCGNSNAPMISLPASQMSTNSYVVSWTGDPNVSTMYTLQEATRSDFSDATTLTISDGSTSKTFLHSAIAADTRFYYRVAAFASCFQTTPPAGPFSTPASILLTVPPPPSSNSFSLTGTPCPQSCTITQTLFIPGFAASGKTALDATDTFSVTSDKPYITISPAAGTLPPDGMNVTLNINTSGLPAGSIESTVSVTKTQAAAGEGVLGTTTTTVPVSVSLVTPVTPVPKDANAPPNTVLVPAIAHADGVNSQFQSDVRITNTASQSISYLLTYTPSGTDGTQSGKQTTITIDAGETKALDDIVKNWFGAGSLGEGGIGTLEIRPLNYAGKTGTDVSFATVAASRTYNTTSTGTFGQFIPAIPLIDFLAKSDTSKISLQQVAQSSAYRTNLGFVEGSGQPVDFVVNLLDDKNNVIATRPYSLQPFEHQQPSLASFFPNTSVSDGRIQVQVTSDTGRLTAYASVLDNVTSDPLLVFPVDPSTIAATRFVVPGVAELNNGAANFHTDMRVFNGGATATNVTLSFPANPAFQPVQQQLAAGEVWSIDNVIPTLWHDVGGGAVVATTDNNAPLVLTARTYSRRDDGGTFGQFIPGVTSSDAVGVGDRPLQVVQLEQSPAFRSNLGLVEVTGSPVTLDIAAFTPDSKVAAHTTVSLAAGQFLQLNSAFAGMGFTSAVYNGRIAVTAISGTGRVAAYGSVVDNRTQDSTYVPAE